MTYYIIEKMHVVDGSVVHTPIGYTTNVEHKTTLNSAFDSGMGAWMVTNSEDLQSGALNPSTYFDSNPDVHYVTGTRTYVNTEIINEITDISGL